jgi:hypothetical protein
MISQLLSSSFQVLIPQVISPLRSKSIRFLECWRWSRLEPEMAFSPVAKCFSKWKFAPEQSALRRNWRHQATHLLSSIGTFFTVVSLSRHWFSSKSTFRHTQSARDLNPENTRTYCCCFCFLPDPRKAEISATFSCSSSSSSSSWYRSHSLMPGPSRNRSRARALRADPALERLEPRWKRRLQLASGAFLVLSPSCCYVLWRTASLSLSLSVSLGEEERTRNREQNQPDIKAPRKPMKQIQQSLDLSHSSFGLLQP